MLSLSIMHVPRTHLLFFFPSPYEFRDPRSMYAGIHNSILNFRENKSQDTDSS